MGNNKWLRSYLLFCLDLLLQALPSMLDHSPVPKLRTSMLTPAGLPPANSLKARLKRKSAPLPAPTSYQTHSQRRALVPSLTTSAPLMLSIPAPNGQDVYTASSTNNNVDHAGLSVPPRLLVIYCVQKQVNVVLSPQWLVS